MSDPRKSCGRYCKMRFVTRSVWPFWKVSTKSCRPWKSDARPAAASPKPSGGPFVHRSTSSSQAYLFFHRLWSSFLGASMRRSSSGAECSPLSRSSSFSSSDVSLASEVRSSQSSVPTRKKKKKKGIRPKFKVQSWSHLVTSGTTGSSGYLS